MSEAVQVKPGAAAGSSFYAGMRVLPRPERQAMYAIYGFCREVDDIADDIASARPVRALALEGWRRDIDALYAGGDPGQAAFLLPHVRRFGLDRADFHGVIDGMAMDVAEDICWPGESMLDLYCDRVASAVGRLSVRVFGMAHDAGERLSHHLGRALQLTNILRDIDEDATIGRVYLPREALESAGVPMTTPAEVVADRRVDQAARLVAARAERHFTDVSGLFTARPRGHLIAPRLMAAAYRSLLHRMEVVGWSPPRTRVRHNRLALLWTLVRLRLGR